MPRFIAIRDKLIDIRAFFIKDFEENSRSEEEVYKAKFLITLSFMYFSLVLLTNGGGFQYLHPYQRMASAFGLLCTCSVPFLVKYVRQLRVACLVFVGGNFLATCTSIFVSTAGSITFFTGIWFVVQYLTAHLACGQKRAYQYLLALFGFLALLLWVKVNYGSQAFVELSYSDEQEVWGAPFILGTGLFFLHYLTSQFVHSEKRLTAELRSSLQEREALVRELNEKQIELLEAKHEAETATKRKSEFLSTMSHEIRTPLNAVVGISHLLQEDQTRSEQLENLNILKFSAENLVALVNNILDFNKIEAGKIELELASFNLSHLLASIHHAHLLQAKKKNISLEVDVASDVPIMLTGDPTRLAQILHNLVGNAVKFTNDGSVKVSVACQSAEKASSTLRFTISDTGIGISEDKLEVIFDSFTQANADTTRRYGGTGLGLAITKRLIELYNSKIKVESKEGAGSTFYFDLKLATSDAELEEALLPDILQNAFSSARGKRVLLAEDNEINVLIAKKHLAKLEVTLDIAQNGEEAVSMVKSSSYDLILMDLHMPLMNGFDAAKEIRSMDENIPIIGLTAAVEDETQLKMQEVGIDEWIFKPIEPKILREVLLKNLVKGECLKKT